MSPDTSESWDTDISRAYETTIRTMHSCQHHNIMVLYYPNHICM